LLPFELGSQKLRVEKSFTITNSNLAIVLGRRLLLFLRRQHVVGEGCTVTLL
jgi:hypothetical protein